MTYTLRIYVADLAVYNGGYYLGVFNSVTGYAEETVEILDHLQHYVDYASMARDMELNGDIFTIELGREVHIFTSH